MLWSFTKTKVHERRQQGSVALARSVNCYQARPLFVFCRTCLLVETLLRTCRWAASPQLYHRKMDKELWRRDSRNRQYEHFEGASADLSVRLSVCLSLCMGSTLSYVLSSPNHYRFWLLQGPTFPKGPAAVNPTVQSEWGVSSVGLGLGSCRGEWRRWRRAGPGGQVQHSAHVAEEGSEVRNLGLQSLVHSHIWLKGSLSLSSRKVSLLLTCVLNFTCVHIWFSQLME